MRRHGLIVKVALVCAVAAALAVGAQALFTEVQAAGCRCPMIYAPVLCDNGKTYPNQCVADCKHAKNCVPIGGPIE